MLEVLRFIFSSFWVWLGTVILVSALAAGFASGAAVLSRRDGGN